MLRVSTYPWSRRTPTALAAIALITPHALIAAPAPASSARASALAAAAFASDQGRRYVSQGKLNEAVGWYEEALSGYQRAGEIGKQAVVLTCLANIHERTKRYDMALDDNQRSLALDKASKDNRSIGVDEYNIGQDLERLNITSEAVAAYLQSAQAFHDAKDPVSEIAHLDQAAAYCETTNVLPQALEIRQHALSVAQISGRQNAQLEQHSKIGALYEAMKLPDKALESRKQALDIARATDNVPAVATQLAAIGQLFESKGDHMHALECHQQALGLNLLVKNHAPEASELGKIAETYDRLGETEKALLYHQSAYEAYNQQGNFSGALSEINAVTRSQLALGRFEQASESANASIAIARKTNRPPALADQLLQLGTAYARLGRIAQASDSYSEALGLVSQHGERDRQRVLLARLADLSLKAGNLQTALARRNQILALDIEARDRTAQAADYAAIGAAHASTGKWSKATDAYSLALTVHRQLGQTLSVRADLHALALICFRGHANTRAIDYHRQALAIDQQTRRVVEAIEDYSGLADCYADVGQLPAALEAQRHVIALDRRLPTAANAGRHLLDLALIQHDLSLKAEALASFQDAATNLPGSSNARLRRLALTESGRLYESMGQYAQALDAGEQALAIARQTNQRAIVQDCLADESRYLVRLDKLDKAKASIDELLTSAKAGGNRAALASAYENQGLLAEASRNLDDACEWNARAVRLRRQIGDWVGFARASRQQIALFASWDRPQLAIAYGKHALNQLQSILWSSRARSIQESSQIELEVAQGYRTLASLLIDQHRLAEATQVIGILKRQELAGFAGQHRWASGSSVPIASLTMVEQSTLARLTDAEGRYCALAESPDTAQLAGEIGDTFTSARRRYHASLMVAGADLPDGILAGEPSRATYASPPVPLSSAASLPPPPGVAIVRMVVSADGCRFLVTTDQGIQAETSSIGAGELRQMAAHWRDQLTNPDVDPRPLGQQLYNVLFAPIKADIAAANVHTILWSLDDVLRYIPMGALYDGNAYLAQNYQNVLLTGSSANDPAAQGKRRSWYVLGVGATKAHESIPARIRSADELRGIIVSAQGRGSLPGTVCLDNQFTQQRFRSELSTGYPVVHVASALAVGSDERASFIVLGDGDLSFLNVLGSNSAVLKDVDLLTVSNSRFDLAFNGGDGHEVEGLGAYARALGASSVLAGLWPAPEASTRRWMSTFYQNKTAATDTTKASAVQAAQLDMIGSAPAPVAASTNQADPLFTAPDSAPFSHPFYWASFQLMGDWR
ncbi:MAG: CHAT domain-containing protein [Capsulimonadaceae bacterium]|nr:CHAT domain-containing protein [Capsulimonadaceae bacterium]